VRQGTSENRDVPIIALTAHSGADAREKARDAGMTAFATKPIDSHELGVLLARVLSERGREGAAGAAGPGAGPNQARGEPWGKVATATPVIRRAEAGFSGTDVVDPARFEATIADIPPDRRSIILERCVQDIRSQMETLQAAGGGNASDGAQLVSSAHVLGGLAETFGADRLARQARALERKGNRGIASGDVKSLLREAEEAAEVLADLARDEEARRREAD
jgi:CheY-like chemotaxis protein